MQSSQENNKPPNHGSETRPFAPFVAETLEVEADDGFYNPSVSYNEKCNLIIACPADKSVQFYDATTLLPSEEFETLDLENEVKAMSFCEDTETFLFGCKNGSFYTFNLSNKILQKLERSVEAHISRGVWINSSYYAYSAWGSYQLHMGNLENGDLFHFPMERSDIFDFRSLPKRNLLFSSLNDGSVIIYRTDRLPKLPILCSIKGNGGVSRTLESVTINKKDFMLTAKYGSTVEVWHLTKGRMRRLKVIQMQEEIEVYCTVYFENYKMVATVHGTEEVRFWRLFSGKLEWRLDVEMNECFHSFLMKDKNAMGVVDWGPKLIKIVQLNSV